ncbi:MAG: biotin--[acetyl-CoA-carboxylase] ligase [Proteobacteria bacterium]|nr:biotin--[acetyl-CoA-carboxylase] ligase [Pseudomonadota bacterium]MDA1355933.1 biotin--[acetyl-CoA-carboxylase] ligase [Pseudomonadota bacterium]
MRTLRLPDEFRLVEMDEVDSTNEEAKRLACSGVADGTLVWAHSQTAGRGRRGRVWMSDPGNLYTSFVLRPDCAPLQAAQLTFVAALAVRDMLTTFLDNCDSIACKWPNDVLVGGRKISGILLESSTAGGGIVDWLVLGIGVNLRHHPDIGGRHPATNLSAEGAGAIEVSSALETLATAFAKRRREWFQGGFEAVRNAWLKHAYGLGKAAHFKLEGADHSGLFIGIDESGALRLKGDGCAEQLFTAGEVTFEGSG